MKPTLDSAISSFGTTAKQKLSNPSSTGEPEDQLRSLPNLLYTDGNQFSLWQNGEIVDAVVLLDGDVATSGEKLATPDLFEQL